MKLFEKIKQYYLPERKLSYREEVVPITKSINENAAALRSYFGSGGDLVLKTVKAGSLLSGKLVLTAAVDGLYDKELAAVSVLSRLTVSGAKTQDDAFAVLRSDVISNPDTKTVTSINEAAALMMSGFMCVFLQGSKTALAVGVQGYAYRSVDEPQTEVLQRGSREGFTEPLKLNQALIRRRLRTGALRFESMQIGDTAKTDVCICYIDGKADKIMLEKLRERLSGVHLQTVFTSGCLVDYLDKTPVSFFNGIGVTERPDTACAKLCEGKAVVIVDGTPSALIVPHIMAENFSTLDDYSNRPYFSSLTRWLKYAAFLIAVMLPGIYVALAMYSPEFFPNELLTRVSASVSHTPFSAFAEVLIFTFIYEVMREAGLRLPKTLGHAVSIIGGLVIGETAVSSGFIGAPTLMIVALTVICSYVIPELYAPISALRSLFIIFGGIWGVWGIMLMACIMIADLCSKESFGVPFLIPLAPFDPFGLRDTAVRATHETLSRKVYEES